MEVIPWRRGEVGGGMEREEVEGGGGGLFS